MSTIAMRSRRFAIFEIQVFPIAVHIVLDVFLSNISFVVEHFGHFTRQWIKFRLGDRSYETIDNVVGHEFEWLVQIAVNDHIVRITRVAGIANGRLIVLRRPEVGNRVQIGFERPRKALGLFEIMFENSVR